MKKLKKSDPNLLKWPLEVAEEEVPYAVSQPTLQESILLEPELIQPYLDKYPQIDMVIRFCELHPQEIWQLWKNKGVARAIEEIISLMEYFKQFGNDLEEEIKQAQNNSPLLADYLAERLEKPANYARKTVLAVRPKVSK